MWLDGRTRAISCLKSFGYNDVDLAVRFNETMLHPINVEINGLLESNQIDMPDDLIEEDNESDNLDNLIFDSQLNNHFTTSSTVEINGKVILLLCLFFSNLANLVSIYRLCTNRMLSHISSRILQNCRLNEPFVFMESNHHRCQLIRMIPLLVKANL